MPDQPDEIQTGFLVDGFRIHDFPRKVQTDHPLDFYEATEVSDNIWFAHAGLDTGPQNMLEWAARYGFGQRIPFDLPTSPSQVTDGGGAYGGFDDRVELANAAYGQAEVLVTPLQMALVAATIANHGLEMQPKLVDYLQTAAGEQDRTSGPKRSRRCATRASPASSVRRCSRRSRASTASLSPARPRSRACRPQARAERRSSAGTRRPTLVHRLCAGGRAEDRDRSHRRGRRCRGAARRAHGRRTDGALSRVIRSVDD